MTAGTGVNAGSVYLYGPELFPTRMRSWSTSVGSAAGRLGSIIAPFAIGKLLEAQLGLSSVFVLLGIACLSGLVAISVFGVETKRRALEDIAH
jgi:putative MFS transporter